MAFGNDLFPLIHDSACISRRSRSGLARSEGTFIKVHGSLEISSEPTSSILFSFFFQGYFRVTSPLSLSTSTASSFKPVDAISRVSLEAPSSLL